MARQGFIFTKIGTTGDYIGNGVTFATFQQAGNDGGVALAAAVATAVADGASPTQAHVTAINTALPTVQGDLQVSFDTSKITTVNQLKRACDALLQAARGAGIAEG
jgi:hypothetical protein